MGIAMNQTGGFVDSIKSNIAKRSDYFANAKSEIAQYNINTLFLASAAGWLISLLMLLITPLIVPTWHFSREYSPLLPMMTAFAAVSWQIRRKKNPSFKLIQWLCALFYIYVLSNLMVIGVFPFPNDPDALFPLFIMILPALLIMKQRYVIFISIGFGLLDIILTLMFKAPAAASHDIFTVFAAVLFSQVSCLPIYELRVSSFLAEEKLKRISVTDSLSGLSNKSAIETKAKEFINRRNLPENWSLAIIDIDGFKSINDAYGHSNGDLVIELIGREIQALESDKVIAGRIGGDEFLILFKQFSARAALVSLFEDFRERVTAVCQKERGFRLTISVGIYIGNGTNHITYSQAFANADQALYMAKAKGKDSCVVHD